MQENLSEGDYPKFILKATSKSDHYGIVFDWWKDLEPFKATLEFDTTLKMVKLKQTDTSFYKCDFKKAPTSNYNCMAQLMSKLNSTKCQKNCVSTRASQGYLPLIEDLSNLKNCTSDEEFCMEKDYKDFETHFSGENPCPNPCKVTRFSGEVEEYLEMDTNSRSIVLFVMHPSPFVAVFEEYLVYDILGMIGAISGSLGICVGFSIYDILSKIVDKIFGYLDQ